MLEGATLLRGHTRRIDLPKHPMPMPMPAESQTMRFWDVPYHGHLAVTDINRY
jgi:hypothetical protein